MNRIKSAVNEALAANGWTAVESGGSDAIVAMEMNQNHSSLNTYYDGFGGGWRRGEKKSLDGMRGRSFKPSHPFRW